MRPRTRPSNGATLDAQGTYASESILEHCVVERAGGGNALGALELIDVEPYVDARTVQDSAAEGIHSNGYGWSGSRQLVLRNSLIQRTRDDGIHATWHRASHFTDNASY